MPYFKCSIVTASGKRQTLVREAPDERELASSFNNTDQILVKYTLEKINLTAGIKRKFTSAVVLEFTQIMSSLINAGLTAQDALCLCAGISGDSKTSWLCKSLLFSLQSGLPFHKALETHPNSFSPLYRSLVKLGEKTGSVSLVFERLSAYLGNKIKTHGKISNALWYPLIVMSAAVAGGIAIIVLVMPRMGEIVTAFGAGSNDVTVAQEIAKMYSSVWFFIGFIVITVCLVIFTAVMKKTSPRFAYLFDAFLLKIPVFGSFVKSIQTMDFSFAMEMLCGSGINIQTALKEASTSVKNKAYAKAAFEVYKKLLKGSGLSASFASFKEFPPYVATWISVGERTGNASSVFSQIKSYFQEDVERASEKFMNLLEPALILATGVFVIIMITRFILPLFSLFGRLL